MDKIEQKIRQIATQISQQIATKVFKDSLKRSQYGVSPVPFHTHNGSDSAFINYVNTVKDGTTSVPNTDTIKFSGATVTNAGKGVANVAITAGSPGGSNTQIQYNSSGSFAGSTALTWNNNTETLIVGDGTNSGVVSSFTSNKELQINLNQNGAGSTTQTGGRLFLYSGVGGSTSGDGGILTLQSGEASTSSVGGQVNLVSGNGGNGGDIVITAGAALVSGGTAGDIILNAGDANTGNTNGGNITLSPGTKTGSGHDGDTIVNANSSAISTSANGGFLIIPHCAGTPTGTPTYTGSMVFDTTNLKLYIWTGVAWKSVLLS